jgi:hypothetical protein
VRPQPPSARSQSVHIDAALTAKLERFTSLGGFSGSWQLTIAGPHYRAVAIHEGAHAAMHVYLGVPFKRVFIRHPKTRRAYVDCNDSSRLASNADLQRWLEHDSIISFAGALAERRYAPRSNWREGLGYHPAGNGKLYKGSDLSHINDNIRRLGMHHKPSIVAYKSMLAWRAATLVKRLWPQIRLIAAVLFEYETLTEDQVRALMGIGPRIKYDEVDIREARRYDELYADAEAALEKKRLSNLCRAFGPPSGKLFYE